MGLTVFALRLVTAVLLVEHVLLALGAAAAGLLTGWLPAPGAPAPGIATIGLVAAMAVGVAVAAAFVPAIRTPRRRAWTITLSAHLPVPLLLAARLAGRRPRRLVLSALSIAITASGIVAVLVFHATDASQGLLAPNNPRELRLDQVTTVISVMLIILAMVNAIFIAWAMALDTRYSSALAQALGATPRQIITGLAVAQMFPAFAGALLGIPGGVGLYDVAKNGGGTAIPPVWWLVAMVLGAVAVVEVLTVIPERIDARRPVAEILQTESD